MSSYIYKVVIVQKICPIYRINLFRALSKKINFLLYYGSGSKNGAFQNANSITGFNSKKLFSIKASFNFRNKSYLMSFFPTIISELVKDKPDLVITEGTTNLVNNLLIYLYSIIYKKPFIWWDAGRNLNSEISLTRRLFEPLIYFFAKRAVCCITYGNNGREYFMHMGIKESQIFVAQNTSVFLYKEKDKEEISDLIDRERKRLQIENKKIILYVGAIEKKRKLDNLINVFSEIYKTRNNIALIIIGDGPEKKELEKVVKVNKLSGILFLNRIEEDLDVYFLLSDVLVLPGWSSLAINQAMTFAKPVITVPYGGPEYELIINGKNGYLVERNNLSQLKEAIEGILFNQQYNLQLGIEAKQSFEKLASIDNMVDQITKAINKSLDFS